MASFDMLSFAQYSFNATFNAYLGPGFTQIPPAGETFTITDNEANGTFEANEDLIDLITSVPFLPGVGEGTFVGTITTNVELVVVQNGGQLFIYSPLTSSATTWPSPQLTIPELDTSLFCFAAGAHIATLHGEVCVEDLQIGDFILIENGGAAPVKWIGRQTVQKLFSGPHMQPVRIRAGALGDGLPHTDLTVTADHGMIIDGLVINASALVNGTTIDFVPIEDLPDRVTYFHIETEHHDVILANGAPAETFVDMAGRSAFDNYQEYLDLYGAGRLLPEMDRPRIAAQRLVPDGIRKKLEVAETEILDFSNKYLAVGALP